MTNINRAFFVEVKTGYLSHFIRTTQLYNYKACFMGVSITARKFSGHVMAICSEILAKILTDGQLQNFFTKYDLLGVYRRLPQGSAKLRRIQEVIAYLDREDRSDKTDDLWDQIVIDGVKLCSERLPNSDPLWQKIEKALRQDGYEIVNGSIIGTLPISPEGAVILGKVEKRLNELGWVVPLRHYEQARYNFIEQQWEAANASIRSFLQGIFDCIAEKMPNFPNSKLEPGGKRRQFLQDIGFLSKEEGELLKALFCILHSKGAHPGLSDENDCSTRILLATAIAWRVLSRLGR